MRTEKAKKHTTQLASEADQKIENAISGRFRERLLSNAKWLKLIPTLVQNVEKTEKILFKKVQDDRIGELFLDSYTIFEYDYWENCFEGMNSLGGFLMFKEIEYLVFYGDISGIKAAIEQRGQFVLVEEDGFLKLMCYR